MDELEELEKLALAEIEEEAGSKEEENEELDLKQEENESKENESSDEDKEEKEEELDTEDEEDNTSNGEVESKFESIEVEISGNKVSINSREELEAFIKRSSERLSNPVVEESIENEYIKQGKLSTEDLRLIIDAKNGNKAAIAKIAKLGKIDLLDVDIDDDSAYEGEFQPVILSDIEKVATAISRDTEHAKEFREISSKLPRDFINAISTNASDLKTFSEHIKSGMAQSIIPEAMKNSILNGTSFSEEYVKVGIKLVEGKTETKKEERTLTDREKELRKKANESKGGNQSSGGKRKLTPDDIANMTDEEFEQLKPEDLE